MGRKCPFDSNKNLDNLKYWSELKKRKKKELLKYVILAVTHVYPIGNLSFVFFTYFEDFTASSVPQGLRSIPSLPKMVFFREISFSLIKCELNILKSIIYSKCAEVEVYEMSPPIFSQDFSSTCLLETPC